MTPDLTRLDTAMSGALIHPDSQKMIAPLPIFQNQAMLPPGLAEEMAEEAGLPSHDFARVYREAWVHALETECNVALVDNDELADLRAAAAAREPKRNQMIEFHTPCGMAMRAMARGSIPPTPPCRAVRHECRAR